MWPAKPHPVFSHSLYCVFFTLFVQTLKSFWWQLAWRANCCADVVITLVFYHFFFTGWNSWSVLIALERCRVTQGTLGGRGSASFISLLLMPSDPSALGWTPAHWLSVSRAERGWVTDVGWVGGRGGRMGAWLLLRDSDGPLTRW